MDMEPLVAVRGNPVGVIYSLRLPVSHQSLKMMVLLFFILIYFLLICSLEETQHC